MYYDLGQPYNLPGIINHGATYRELLRIRSCDSEALTPTHQCMCKKTVYEKLCRVYKATRTRPDIGENSKTPTIKTKFS